MSYNFIYSKYLLIDYFLESIVTTEDVHNDDLKIVSIPKNLHEHFECVVGKHVFLDKPWTLISHKKVIDHLQLYSAKSCFWPIRKKIKVKKKICILKKIVTCL